MKLFLSTYFKISGLCVFIMLFIESFILKCLFKMGYESVLPAFFVAVLSGTGIYFALYKLSCWIYQEYLWHYLFRSLDLHGTWYHEIRCQENPDYLRRGRTSIVQSFNEIQITGVNYNPDFEVSSRSIWYGTLVNINDNGQLVFTYHTTRAGKDKPQDKTGQMSVVICLEPGKKPHRLEGVFRDSYPSELRGAITWERQASWQDSFPSLHNSGVSPEQFNTSPGKTG